MSQTSNTAVGLEILHRLRLIVYSHYSTPSFWKSLCLKSHGVSEPSTLWFWFHTLPMSDQGTPTLPGDCWWSPRGLGIEKRLSGFLLIQTKGRICIYIRMYIYILLFFVLGKLKDLCERWICGKFLVDTVGKIRILSPVVSHRNHSSFNPDVQQSILRLLHNIHLTPNNFVKWCGDKWTKTSNQYNTLR